MSKEARPISAARKMEQKPSAAERWDELKLRAVHRTEAKQPNGSTSDHHPSTSGHCQNAMANRQPSVNRYLDRITAAGLHNYLNAIERYEIVVWRFTFLVAIVGTLFYLVTTIRAYLEFTIVLDIQHETEPAVRLPDVWVCMETINVSYINEQFEKARPKLIVDGRVRLLAERWVRVFKLTEPFYSQWNSTTMTYDNVSSVWNSSTMRWEYRVEDMIDRIILFSKHFSITSPVGDEFHGGFSSAFVYVQLLDATAGVLGADWHGLKAFYEEGMFGCESVLKNCTLNGITVDCCKNGPMGYSRGTSRCFRLDVVNQTTSERKEQKSTGSSITLSFETIIDSTYFREFHSAAYSATAAHTEATGLSIAFGHRMAGLFEDTLQLAPATVSTMTVKATKKEGLTKCIDAYKFDPRLHTNSHPLIMNYFKEMIDPKQYNVATCEMGKLVDAIYRQCGCVLYYDTIRPRNDSDICSPAHMYSCVYRAFHDVSPDDKPDAGDSSSTNSSANPQDESKQATMLQLKIDSASECLPLCESWTYDYRASSMIAAGLEGNVSRYFRNKVTIIIDPEYRVETEVYKMDYSTLIASLGDGFGLILGFSAITLIQLPIWTIAAVVLRRRLNKISPPQRQGAVNCQRLHLHQESAV